MANIYISSSFSDLKEYRKAVYEVLNQLGHEVIAKTMWLQINRIGLQGAHSRKGGIFFALKGLYIPAQGNALGNTLQ